MKRSRRAAERLAQALADAVPGAEPLAAVHDDMKRLAEVFEASRDLRRILGNPVVPAASKEGAVRAIAERLDARRETLAAFRALAARDAFTMIPDIARELGRLVDRRRGIHEVEVASAAPLDEGVRQKLLGALTQMTGGQVRLVERTDASLLGGLVIRMGGRVYDGSVKSGLAQIRERMMAGAGA
ncbi:MAG: ATP synthase F1 subunit delta [Acidobacteria bacterium]|nr:ATP synthase F1 subunit delta [Acidobacteriota bacterium]